MCFWKKYNVNKAASGYVRNGRSIEKKDQTNAFAKHLAEHHPAREGDVKCFTFKVLKTFRKSLYMQEAEAVRIHGCRTTFVMNSRP